MGFGGGEHLGALLQHLAPGLRAREFPFIEVDRAVAVQVEALQQRLVIGLPLGQQVADLRTRVEHRRDAAERREVADHIQRIVRDQRPLRVALVAPVEHVATPDQHVGALGVDRDHAAAVFEQEGRVALLRADMAPFAVALLALRDHAVPQQRQRIHRRQQRRAVQRPSASAQFGVALCGRRDARGRCVGDQARMADRAQPAEQAGRHQQGQPGDAPPGFVDRQRARDDADLQRR